MTGLRPNMCASRFAGGGGLSTREHSQLFSCPISNPLKSETRKVLEAVKGRNKYSDGQPGGYWSQEGLLPPCQTSSCLYPSPCEESSPKENTTKSTMWPFGNCHMRERSCLAVQSSTLYNVSRELPHC